MKCPHCGQEHPDNTKFCLETGKKLEQQFRFCDNPDCNFRQPLPPTANFCPNCGKPLSGQAKRQFSKKENAANCIMLKVGKDRVRFIDTKCNTLYEESFQLLVDLDDETHSVPNCIVSNNRKAFFVQNDGQLLEFGDYNVEDNLSISSDGEDVLILRHRNASLYKKDNCAGFTLVSQFRMKVDECGFFSVIGDYISFACYDWFGSINFSTGETIKIPGYKYSMLITKRGEECLFFASNASFVSYSKIESFCVVNIHGEIVKSFPRGIFFPFSETYLLWRNGGRNEGLISIDGEEIIPLCFGSIGLLDEKHLLLHLGDRLDWRRKELIYDLHDKSFTTEGNNDTQKVTCRGKQLPTSSDELYELLGEYEFGFGDSSDLYVNENNEIVRRIDQIVIYQMDENEYPIGASDELHRFGIYDREYLSVYDNEGEILKEFYRPNGIANPRLYSNGIILFFDNELRELGIINDGFKLTVIHRDSCFGGDCEAFSSNCIAVQMPFTDTPEWKLYNTVGELILPEETSVFSWKKLNDEFVVLETGNYKTNQNLEYDEKEGLLLNLNDNSVMPIPFSYKHAFILK